jgi:hypothetical protein
MLIYEPPEKEKEQKACDHDWHGPCIDEVSRYFKCRKCFCLDRDIDPCHLVADLAGKRIMAELDRLITDGP